MSTCQVCGSEVPEETGLTVGDFRAIVSRWERLRLFYVGWLAIVVFAGSLVLAPLSMSFDYWLLVATGAVVANLCYLAGPAIELYGTSFRVWDGSWTILLFIAGTVFATLLAIATLIGFASSPFALV